MDSKPLYTKIMVPNGQQCHLEPQEEGLTREVSRPRVCCVLAHAAQATLCVPSHGPGCAVSSLIWPRLPCVSSLVWSRPCLPQHQAELSWKCKGCRDTVGLSLVLTWGAGWGDWLFCQFCLSKAEEDPTQVPALPVLSSWTLFPEGVCSSPRILVRSACMATTKLPYSP